MNKSGSGTDLGRIKLHCRVQDSLIGDLGMRNHQTQRSVRGSGLMENGNSMAVVMAMKSFVKLPNVCLSFILGLSTVMYQIE